MFNLCNIFHHFPSLPCNLLLSLRDIFYLLLQYIECSNCGSFDHSQSTCPLLPSCKNCMSTTHINNCPLPVQHICKTCFKANTRTQDCDCNDSLWGQMQTLRLVGARDDAVPIIDVRVYTKIFAALVNTGSANTYITPKVQKEFEGDEQVSRFGLYNNANTLVALQLHMSIGSRLVWHPCYIHENISHDIVLGADFLLRYGFTLRLGKFEVNNFSPTFTTAKEVQYWRSTLNAIEHKLIKVNLQPQHSPRVLPGVSFPTKEQIVEQRKKRTTKKDADVLALYPSDSDLEF